MLDSWKCALLLKQNAQWAKRIAIAAAKAEQFVDNSAAVVSAATRKHKANNDPGNGRQKLAQPNTKLCADLIYIRPEISAISAANTKEAGRFPGGSLENFSTLTCKLHALHISKQFTYTLPCLKPLCGIDIWNHFKLFDMKCRRVAGCRRNIRKITMNQFQASRRTREAFRQT